jgi:hypothetical protein
MLQTMFETINGVSPFILSSKGAQNEREYFISIASFKSFSAFSGSLRN